MKRRSLIIGGASIAAAAAATHMAQHNGLIPPDWKTPFGLGGALTYASQRVLLGRGQLAREFKRSDISAAFPVNGDPPRSEVYGNLADGDFKAWRLSIDGLVARPMSYSLADLKAMPVSGQITLHACEEGWSAIAEWTGVRLATLLNLAGIRDAARYVAFFPFDTNWDSLDIYEALHPQTLLAYGMNGAELPMEHGAPLRLRVPRQLGYKSVKYLSRIYVTDSLRGIGSGKGSISPDLGYSWYAGI